MTFIDPKTRLRWRRQLRKGKKQVAEAGTQTDVRLDRYVLRRFTRLVTVRRFVIMWVCLLAVSMVSVFMHHRQLSPYYQEVRAVAGGTYREAILGSFTNANPMYASGSANGAVSKLLFSSLFTYNEFNELVGDLALAYEVDETGLEYTVSLREDVSWHDGEPFTAADVVFTYETIANPDARSPLFMSWRDTEVEKLDTHTVQFKVPSPFVAFPLAMTNGIVPKHILEDVSPSQLRSSSFNTAQPIGTGPFAWETLEVVGLSSDVREERIALRAYEDYHSGRPNLDRFIIRTFRDSDRMIQSFINRDVNALVGVDSVNHELLQDHPHQVYTVPITGQVGVFFKTTEPIFENRRARQALVRFIDTEQIRSQLSGPIVPSDSPLLRSHDEYDPELLQLAYDPERAAEFMEDAGWERNDEGFWEQDGEVFSFPLVALNSTDGRLVSQALQQQWYEHGIRVEVTLQDDSDLQSTIAQHDYVAILHGISIGSDPDVFAYWHSSQADILADSRLNLSDYSSADADASLESGRTRSDDELRSVKYQPFLEAWRADAPALMLYQPRFIYITQSEIEGFRPLLFNTGTDRMYSVHHWFIRRSLEDRLPIEVQ